MKLRGLSIRWKMSLLYTGLLGILLVLFSLFLFITVEKLLTDNLIERLDAHFDQALVARPALILELSDSSDQSGFHRNTIPNVPFETETKQLQTLESMSGPGLFFQIRDTTGRVVATSTNLLSAQLPPPAQPLARPGDVQDDQIQVPVARVWQEGAAGTISVERLQMRSGILLDMQGNVVGTLQVAQSLRIVDDVRNGLLLSLGIGLLLAVAVALFAGLWLARRSLQPIAHITDIVRKIGRSGDLSQRVVLSEQSRTDEISHLALTFNGMLEELEKAFTAQKQFVADASHELRTPLTAILGHANLLKRHGKTDPALVEESALAIIDQAERLHRLTTALLQLARTAEHATLPMEKVSMAHLAEEVVRDLAPLSQHKGIIVTVQTEAENEPWVCGDKDKLKQLTLNLVDNALKFTPAGGQVQVSVHQVGQNVVLEVSDSGKGIAADHLPHIFTRFYRADAARSRAQGGSGLGLAIVQEVVRLHGGTVAVESEPGQGTTFRVALPGVRQAITSV